MKKLIALVFAIFLLTGCGQISRITALWTGYDEVCVDGVSYIQFSSGVSVKYDQSGKVVSCE